MKLNNKGFAISTIVYMILIMGIVLIALTLSILSSRKLILDASKEEALNNIYKYKKYKNGEVVYFDVSKGKTCSNYIEENSNTGYNGIDNKIGNQNSCLKFYAFNDSEENKKVSLLLDHNTTSQIAWNSSGNNTNGPKELLEQLKIDTKDWKGTLTPINYSIDQSSTNKAKYTVDYSEYKSRIISAEEVTKITGNINWNQTDYFYFDTNTTTESSTCKEGNITGCKYGWLYDRMSSDCTNVGCLFNSVPNDAKIDGYWTITSFISNSIDAWSVDTHLCVSHTDYLYNGVRPVIEVLKSNLKR